MSTTTCTVPISTLQAAPYNLAWGATVYAKVLATNAVGSSALSVASSGVIITTNPDPPSLLANNAATTSASVIAITWAPPALVGGTPVIDYQVSWKIGTATYVILASSITTAFYSVTSTLTPNTFY